MRPGGDRLGAAAFRRAFVKEQGIVFGDHAAAGA